MQPVTHPGALHLVASRLAEALRPAPPMRVSEWLAENFVLVDGPFAGQLWSAENAPYLAEIADCLSDDDPSNLVTVRKSQQTGASILALGWVLYCAAREPANMLYAAPNLAFLRDMNSAKLTPAIAAQARRAGGRPIIAPSLSRSGEGSTTFEKIFTRGGRLFLGNANSVTDLSARLSRKASRMSCRNGSPSPARKTRKICISGASRRFWARVTGRSSRSARRNLTAATRSVRARITAD